MARYILIADDVEVNRIILGNMLSPDYTILTATGGTEALEILRTGTVPISAVLLDINMPDMDGYQTLSHIRADKKLASLPVIMITAATDEESRVTALSMGANDYVTSPYNADIIRHCLRNQIALSEAAATVDTLQRDSLAGMYIKEVFLEKAAQYIESKPEGYYVLSCLDINNFKIINDQYGRTRGDEVLKALSAILLSYEDTEETICGRYTSDNFVHLRPAKQKLDENGPELIGQAVYDATGIHITVAIGRMVVDDKSLSVSDMYDRARIALATIKGRFDLYAATFDESMRAKVIREQEIISEMSAALSQRQFEVWFQPQYNHSTGALIGAEALARWRHPQKGLIPPDEFIPIFEENGFIYSLDRFIWEESCRCLRHWIDQGQSPLPISVNISRIDILHSDLVDVLEGLLEQYSLARDWLRLEVTETAFSNDQSIVIAMVKKLIDRGFTVEIDDFGSGYSSLNTLKDVPAQILKLDMRFLHSSDSHRGGNIVESVVRMAKWLGMSVIAEGVETLEQSNFLRSIGCFYVQGYYFARPMPVAEYEAHCRKAGGEERLLSMETVENLDNNSLWDPDSMDSLIFNSFVGGACIFEYHDDSIEILRSTDTFVQMLGEGMQAETLLKLDLMEHIDRSCKDSFLRALGESAAEKRQISTELVLRDLPGCPGTIYLRTALRVIATVGKRYLVYAGNENITAQRLAEQQLRSIMENINSGITAVVFADGTARHLFANDRYFTLMGLEKPQDSAAFTGWKDVIHPEDRHIVTATSDAVRTTGRSAVVEYRIIRPDGQQRWLRSSIAQMEYPGVDGPVQLTVTSDITESEKNQRDMLDNLPGGAGLYELRDGRMSLVYQNKSYWELVGLGDIAYPDPTPMSAVHPEDIPLIMEELGAAMSQGRNVSCEIRLRHLTKGYQQVHLAGRIVQSEPGCFLIYTTFTPQDDVSSINKKTLSLLLSAIMSSSGDYVYAKDRELRYICCSPAVAAITGHTESELKGKTDYDLYPPDMAEQFRLNDVALLAGEEKLTECEETIITPEGEEHLCHTSKYVLRDSDGEIIGLLGVSRDLTSEYAILTRRMGDTSIGNEILQDRKRQYDALEQLRMSREESALALEHAGNIVCRFSVAERCLTMDPTAAQRSSLPERLDKVPEAQVQSGLISPDTAEAYTEFYENIINGGKKGSVLFRQLCADSWRWMEARSSTIFANDGRPVRAIISMFDVTERQEKEIVYRKWLQSLENMPPQSHTLYRLDLNSEFCFVSKKGELITFDFNNAQHTVDQRTKFYAESCVLEEDRQAYIAFLSRDSLLAGYYSGRRTKTIEYREMLTQDSLRWLRLTVDLVENPDSGDIEAFLLYEDIDTSKRMELQTKKLSESDPLTGLLNRSTFSQMVDDILASADKGAKHALLMLDIDGFKRVNDVFGHGTGDEALVEIAEMLKATVRSHDLVARLGGDEFMVFLTDIKSENSALHKAEKICAMVRKSFSLEVQISGSVGLVIAPENGGDFASLYKKADAALYYAKGTGKDNAVLYDSSMDDQLLLSERNEETEKDLKKQYKKRRMLIVDDNNIDNTMLKNIFDDEFITEKAKDGNSALIRLRHYGSAISVVLLDLIMPGMDGFAVLAAMRQNEELRSIPVVIVSSDDSRDSCLRAIRSGATDFVTKPVDPELLRIRVHSAVSKAENERLRAKNTVLEQQSAQCSILEQMLENSGVAFVEYNWHTGLFKYHSSVPLLVAGNYDDRSLWHILLSDMVADTNTVQNMQNLVHQIADDRNHIDGTMLARLKTPSGPTHCFRMNVRKKVDEFRLTTLIYISLTDTEFTPH